MNYAEAASKMGTIQEQMKKLRAEAISTRRATEPELMKPYSFLRSTGEKVSWAELFGRHDDLFVIHNMGKSCAHCTLWADGYNGVYEHLADRAGFVVVSPDAPEVQRAFAASRHWRFPMISYQGNSFGEDTGYRRDGRSTPGVSAFKRRGKDILRVSNTHFDAGDLFCSVWHFLDLLPEGANGWQPKFAY